MAWSRPVGWALDHLVYRTSVTGRDNVPTGGPVIFAGNHISFLDGPVMFGASPRPMHILVKQEMFKGFLDFVPRPGRRFHVSFGSALTLARRAGESGRASMDRAAQDIRAALAGHVQDTIQLSGQPLPFADHNDLTAVAGDAGR
jgi:hypothetical protein